MNLRDVSDAELMAEAARRKKIASISLEILDRQKQIADLNAEIATLQQQLEGLQ